MGGTGGGPVGDETGSNTSHDGTGATSGTATTTDSSETSSGGDTTPLPGDQCVSDWSSLGSGVSSTACVRLAGGEIACADLDNGSPTSFKKLTLNGETLTQATYAVGRGFHFAHCASVGGAVYCGNQGTLNEPAVIETGASYLTGGYHSGCAVINNGGGGGDEVHCFPENGATQVINLPSSRVISLSGTYNYACAALADGSVHCWGEGGNSYLAEKGATETTPVAIAFPSAVTVVGASQYSVCGALASGGLHCDGSSNQSSFPKSDEVTFDATYFGTSTISAIAPGQFATCFLAEGSVHCSSATQTKVVNGLNGVEAIAGGRKWACAAQSNGSLACWKKGQGGETYETTTATLEGGGALQLEAAPCP